MTNIFLSSIIFNILISFSDKTIFVANIFIFGEEIILSPINNLVAKYFTRKKNVLAPIEADGQQSILLLLKHSQ